MPHIRIAVVLYLLAISSAHAGDTTKVVLVGNPTVDFFSSTNLPGPPSSPKLLADEPATHSDGGRKSPFLAAVMSLVVPGAGEVYAGDYVKGAGVFAAQVFSIGAALNYSSKARQQEQIDKDYVNTHWSAVRYINWTLDNLQVLNPNIQTTAAEFRQSIFYHGDTVSTPPPFPNVNWSAMNAMENAVGYNAYNSYSHYLFPYGTDQYYKELGKYHQWSAGWDDGLSGTLTANQVPISYESPHFVLYRSMRAEADALNLIGSTWVAISIVEHFLSAVDAVWSSIQHNNALHADARMFITPTPNGIIPTGELTLQYSFQK